MLFTLSVSPHNTTLCKNRSIRYIVIHYAANTRSTRGSALNVASWFKDPENTGGSADFIVDDELTVQYNPDVRNRYCWAVGGRKYQNSLGGSIHGICGNKNSVSIEICSTSRTGKVLKENDPRWYFTEAAIDRAVELTLYLMKEYNVPVERVVRHYDVSGKLCPGLYGWNKESESESAWRAFQKRLQSSTATVSSSVVSGASDAENALWSFLKAKGMNDFAVAGILGNLYAESGVRPNNLQDSFEKRLQFSDEDYTESVDEGSYQEFAMDGAGYGICQWTYWRRKEKLYNLSKEMKKSIGSLDVQQEMLWRELREDYSQLLVILETAKSVREASDAFLFQFERPLDQSESVQVKRAKYGQEIYDRHAKEVSFTVKITASKLNIRAGAGTSFAKNGSVPAGGVFTIVEVDGDWGKLKSGAGWINLNYAERV